MTADDADAPENGPLPDAPAKRPYAPKPPLWRPLRERRRSTRELVIGGVVLALVASVFGAVLLEPHFFSGSATAMPVTIAAIESVSHADEDSPGFITYMVTLPDGSQARFTSPRTNRPGTRLLAMVSRGWITGRTIVASPYSILPNE